ncbi:MAG: flagellin B, partial [Campylobacterota bacterium]|nr:flagellin B [Campylobacterota bacterium]
MGFRINTNIAAMDAWTKTTQTNRELDKSLARLSSGLRINTAADDASGLTIADSLRSQANSLGQAIANAGDAIGVIQTADKAMDEQLKILDTIKTKAVQAASDTQNATSREAIQKDVNRLLEQLDNIAKTTSFNGQVLLSGTYTNKSYQVGAYSNQTISASIGNTQSLAIGNIASKTDIAQVGNQGSDALDAALVKDATVLYMSTAITSLDISNQGLAQGDTIRIDGVGDYTITQIDGTLTQGGALSTAILHLDRGLEKTMTAGTTFAIALVQTASEDLNTFTGTSAITGAAGDDVLNSSDV